MKVPNAAYFANRADVEAKLALASRDRRVRRIHAALAAAYEQKVAEFVVTLDKSDSIEAETLVFMTPA